METLNIPDGYNQVMPYLILEGAAGFMEFTQKVFGAAEKFKTMRDENVIMHAEISIGQSVIMIADATEQYSRQNANLFIYVANCNDTYQNALNNGAVTLMPPADQSYGRSCGVTDPFGNTWWITGI